MNYEDFINTTLADFGFNLQATTRKIQEGYIFDITGKDVQILLGDNAELLDALEHILFQIYGHDLPRTERFICDADGFRQTRRTELVAMAHFAANSVRKTGRPFAFGVLTSSERRVIHLALQDEADLETESIGDGRTRRLQIKAK
ncbi:MAG: hypothetical protein H7Z37_08280 [Pyrinomonadaceae bacterium]|nr:hypothetical protein [Pyrinomonadaceae bacterium]